MKETQVNNRVAIFGGEGNMGRFTVDLFKNLEYEVISVDPKNPSSPPAKDAICQSEVVFFSVSANVAIANN